MSLKGGWSHKIGDAHIKIELSIICPEVISFISNSGILLHVIKGRKYQKCIPLLFISSKILSQSWKKGGYVYSWVEEIQIRILVPIKFHFIYRKIMWGRLVIGKTLRPFVLYAVKETSLDRIFLVSRASGLMSCEW